MLNLHLGSLRSAISKNGRPMSGYAGRTDRWRYIDLLESKNTDLNWSMSRYNIEFSSSFYPTIYLILIDARHFAVAFFGESVVVSSASSVDERPTSAGFRVVVKHPMIRFAMPRRHRQITLHWKHMRESYDDDLGKHRRHSSTTQASLMEYLNIRI